MTITSSTYCSSQKMYILGLLVLVLSLETINATPGPRKVVSSTDKKEAKEEEGSDIYKVDLVCEHQEIHLECPKGHVIQIISALYGREDADRCRNHGTFIQTCVAGGALEIMKHKCDNRQHCYVKTENDVFNVDPCKGLDLSKYLEVKYKCKKVEFSSALECQNEIMELRCTSGKLWIFSAVYGRGNATACNKCVVKNTHCAFSALTVMSTRCNSLTECKVEVKDNVFGDPCPYTCKYLEVDYECETCVGRRKREKHTKIPQKMELNKLNRKRLC